MQILLRRCRIVACEPGADGLLRTEPTPAAYVVLLSRRQQTLALDKGARLPADERTVPAIGRQ
ncbi:hypothetical protein [Mesorhizobium temperatum]|uniref:hypothetical protein n=1 Tax=Mesorhizobium temperatum TaxID=241416 RepID=UPI00117DC18A|nr:hypothetical protein [Mesorhizobium temperatum]